jgi:hypothetical protein
VLDDDKFIEINGAGQDWISGFVTRKKFETESIASSSKVHEFNLVHNTDVIIRTMKNINVSFYKWLFIHFD